MMCVVLYAAYVFQCVVLNIMITVLLHIRNKSMENIETSSSMICRR